MVINKKGLTLVRPQLIMGATANAIALYSSENYK